MEGDCLEGNVGEQGRPEVRGREPRPSQELSKLIEDFYCTPWEDTEEFESKEIDCDLGSPYALFFNYTPPDVATTPTFSIFPLGILHSFAYS